MKNDALVGIKLPKTLAQEIARRAKADDRTVSAFLRRLIAANLAVSTGADDAHA